MTEVATTTTQIHSFRELNTLNGENHGSNLDTVRERLAAEGFQLYLLPQTTTLVVSAVAATPGEGELLATLAQRIGERNQATLTMFQNSESNVDALLTIIDAVAESYK